MTEEKSKVELEKIKKNARIAWGFGVIVALVGAMIALMSIVALGAGGMFPDREHITDQNMPVRDFENATYTWTSKEIKDMQTEQINVTIVGGIIAGIGMAIYYTAAALEPSKKTMHKVGCKKAKDYQFCPECGAANKYCPECGLNLLKLEKKE